MHPSLTNWSVVGSPLPRSKASYDNWLKLLLKRLKPWRSGVQRNVGRLDVVVKKLLGIKKECCFNGEIMWKSHITPILSFLNSHESLCYTWYLKLWMFHLQCSVYQRLFLACFWITEVRMLDFQRSGLVGRIQNGPFRLAFHSLWFRLYIISRDAKSIHCFARRCDGFDMTVVSSGSSTWLGM